MTFLGQVFTYILLVLNLLFFVLAGMVNSKHMSYRNLVEDKQNGLKVQLSREQNKTKEQGEMIQRLKDSMAVEQLARRSAISSLQSQLDLLNTELSDRAKAAADFQSQVTQLNNTVDLAQKELAARTKENQDLRQQLVQARQDRDNTYQNFAQTYDKYIRLVGQNEALTLASLDIDRRYRAAKQKLDILDIAPDQQLDGAPPVNGVVSAVSNNLVEVSIGRDDGIYAGHELDVYRGGQYVGRIRVKRSEDDKAVGEILQSFSRGFIGVGDRVDSRISQIYVKDSSAGGKKKAANGVVTAIANGMVEMSIGLEDGVEQGQEIGVYRGGEAMGNASLASFGNTICRRSDQRSQKGCYPSW